MALISKQRRDVLEPCGLCPDGLKSSNHSLCFALQPERSHTSNMHSWAGEAVIAVEEQQTAPKELEKVEELRLMSSNFCHNVWNVFWFCNILMVSL